MKAAGTRSSGVKKAAAKAPAADVGRSGPGRPRKLTREAIIEAAMRVMDREGYAALTLRSLGQEIGLSHSNLYKYVGDIEDVEAEVLRQLSEGLPVPTAKNAAGLKKELVEYLLAAREVFLRHPMVMFPKLGSAAAMTFTAVTHRWLEALMAHENDAWMVGSAYSALLGTVRTHAEREHVQGGAYRARLATDMARQFPQSRVLRQLEESGKDPDFLRGMLEDLIDRLLPSLATRRVKK